MRATEEYGGLTIWARRPFPSSEKDVMQVEPRPYGRRRELVLIALIALLGLVTTVLLVIPGAFAA